MNSIASERKKIGITQAVLAEHIGWVQSRIGNYESSARRPDLNSCRQIVDALNRLGGNCTLDDVFPPKES